jgi:hypothetical protein
MEARYRISVDPRRLETSTDPTAVAETGRGRGRLPPLSPADANP